MINTMEGVTPKGEGGLIGKVDRAFAKLENIFNAIAALFVVVVMVYMCAEVLSRKFLGRPLPGVIDWVELLMATFAFLGAAYCQRLGGHVRMEILVGRLRGRILWLLEAVTTTIALIYICIVGYKSYTESFMWAYELGDSTMDIYLPVWPSKLIVPVALAVLAIRLAINLWGYLRLFLTPDATPYAVPMIKHAAEHAREEIEDAMGHDADEIIRGSGRDDDR